MSGERYKETISKHSSYPFANLGDICVNYDGKRVPITRSDRIEGVYPYFGASGIVDYVEDFLFNEDLLLVSEDGANLLARSTPIAFSVSGKIWVNNHAHVLKFASIATQKYVEYILNSMSLEPFITGSAQPKLNQKALNSIQIPLPPLSVLEEIVAEIEAYQKIIDGAKMVVSNYKPKIDIDPEWEMVELGKACELNPKKSELSGASEELEVSFVPMADLYENQIDFVPKQIKLLNEVFSGYTYFKEDDVLLAPKLSDLMVKKVKDSLFIKLNMSILVVSKTKK